MSNLYIETPTLLSEPLSEGLGKPVWLKLENLQPSGSFKLRGVAVLCQHEVAAGARGLVSSSGGNAGIAVAYVGRKLSIPVRVVVPESTTAQARESILAQGAQLTVHGASWYEANAYAEASLAADEAFIHPFDHPLLWQGHSTMIDEIARDGIKPGAVRCLSAAAGYCAAQSLACSGLVGPMCPYWRWKLVVLSPLRLHWTPVRLCSYRRLPVLHRRWVRGRFAIKRC